MHRIYGYITAALLAALFAMPATGFAEDDGAIAAETATQLPEDAPQMPSVEMEDMPIAVLRSLDKVTARTSTFEIPIDKTVTFGGSLFIRVKACREAPPIATPESAAFLQIWEHRPDDVKSRWVFSGWMFASSPSLSAMDHPVFDVWVIDCKNASTSEEEFTSADTPEESVEDAGVGVSFEDEASGEN